MADTTTYFGNAVPATYPDGGPIIVNGRPLLLPQNFDLRTQINAARFQSTQNLGSLAGWFYEHYAPGSSGDPQRQAGYSGGFDPTYTDGGNYGYGLSAAAAGLNLDLALLIASNVNFAETGKPLPLVNERAIRQAYGDYVAKRFPDIDHEAGKAYIDSVSDSDAANAKLATANVLKNARADIYSHAKNYFFPQVTETDVQRYAKAHWGDLNSPDAQAFMANFQQAFGSYPQHLDLDLLHPLPADGSIPNGKDVSLFVGRNGEVLTYARTPAPGGTGALRGIYGLDGGPNGVGSTGMNFFRDGTPQPASVLSHPTTPSDPTGGIDVTLPSGAGEHWWYDRIDGFIRRQQDYAYVGRGYDTPSERLGHLPSVLCSLHCQKILRHPTIVLETGLHHLMA